MLLKQLLALTVVSSSLQQLSLQSAGRCISWYCCCSLFNASPDCFSSFSTGRGHQAGISMWRHVAKLLYPPAVSSAGFDLCWTISSLLWEIFRIFFLCNSGICVVTGNFQPPKSDTWMFSAFRRNSWDRMPQIDVQWTDIWTTWNTRRFLLLYCTREPQVLLSV